MIDMRWLLEGRCDSDLNRRLSFLVLGLALALLYSAGALAVDPRPETKKLNAADQAAARAVLVQRADLQPASGWNGGAIKPDSLSVNCPYYHPDLSQFVTTGEAASLWNHAASGLRRVVTETGVSQTAQMQRREWQLQLQPAAIRCVRSLYARQAAAAGAMFVSFKRVSLPHLAANSAAFELRAISAAPSRERVVAEFVLVGRSRTGITVVVSGDQSARLTITAESLRLARLLVRRIQA
jgi:hypothetical protein